MEISIFGTSASGRAPRAKNSESSRPAFDSRMPPVTVVWWLSFFSENRSTTLPQAPVLGRLHRIPASRCARA